MLSAHGPKLHQSDLGGTAVWPDRGGVVLMDLVAWERRQVGPVHYICKVLT